MASFTKTSMNLFSIDGTWLQTRASELQYAAARARIRGKRINHQRLLEMNQTRNFSFCEMENFLRWYSEYVWTKCHGGCFIIWKQQLTKNLTSLIICLKDHAVYITQLSSVESDELQMVLPWTLSHSPAARLSTQGLEFSFGWTAYNIPNHVR